MVCADCGTELSGVSRQAGKKKADRRTVCLMCADKATGKRDKRGYLK